MFKRKAIQQGRIVIAHLHGGRSIAGILYLVASDGYVLRAARTLPLKEKVVGDAVIPREQLDWFQSDVPAHILSDEE